MTDIIIYFRCVCVCVCICVNLLSTGHIVVDVCAFESGEVATNVSLDAMNENDIDLLKPMSRRYVLPLSQLGLVDEVFLNGVKCSFVVLTTYRSRVIDIPYTPMKI